MEELVDVILDSGIPMKELVEVIERERDRRSSIESMRGTVAFVLYENMRDIDTYWELSLAEDDDEIVVRVEGGYTPLPDMEGYPVEDDVYIYNVGNAEAVLNSFLHIDSLMLDSIVYISIDKLCPMV